MDIVKHNHHQFSRSPNNQKVKPAPANKIATHIAHSEERLINRASEMEASLPRSASAFVAMVSPLYRSEVDFLNWPETPSPVRSEIFRQPSESTLPNTTFRGDGSSHCHQPVGLNRLAIDSGAFRNISPVEISPGCNQSDSLEFRLASENVGFGKCARVNQPSSSFRLEASNDKCTCLP